eukprot:TRINITY_DN503_c0_g1_i1.p1 TRINITY_DN503_c0_g1~~TRINITY_DN503_c0_g1_i1.p1  ORF type:complete len:1125 (-),score=402.34 TRINITY_DN503_c0_g1_i1:64-3297(-)
MADTANAKGGKNKGGKATEKPASENSPKNKKDNTPGGSPANPPKAKETSAPKPNAKEAKPATDKPNTKAEAAPSVKSTDAPKAPEQEQTPSNDAQAVAAVAPSTQNQGGNKGQEQREKKAPPQKPTGKGSVKYVLSGDTFVIINLSKGQQGPPSEMTFSLSNIVAPSMGRRGGDKEEAKDESKEEKEEEETSGKRKQSTVEEAYAWESREFLRKMIAGQQVAYVIEASPSGGKKSYGVIYLDNGTNVAEQVVANGWAAVRDLSITNPWPELEALIDLNTKAKNSHLGIYAKNPKPVRKVPKSTDSTNSELFERSKGKPQTAVVEQVITGSTLRVSLAATHHEVVLILSGVECPMINPKRKIAEPFSREAKFYTEYKVLGRDVEVFFEGADRQNLYGSVIYKDGERQGHLNTELLAQGLGTYVDWSGQRTGQYADKLKAAEKNAKANKLRVWAEYTAPKGLSGKEDKGASKAGKEFVGRVTEIVNPTCIMVVDQKSMDHKIWLSSVRPKKPQARDQGEKGEKGEKEAAPKDKNQRKEEDPAAAEAKEMLRKRLIGQKVRCVFDYTQPSSQPGPTGDDRDCYSVYVDKNNVAVELVEQGLIVAAQHRGGEPRSRDYELMLFAEGRATKAQRGLHATGDRKIKNQMQDVREASVAKAKFPSLERAGKLRGVVDYEFSATKIKLLVPKETCKIVLALSGVTTGTRAGQELTKEQTALAAEALFFVKEKIHQHDVEFQVTGLDKSHTFIGQVWVGRQSLASMLLEQGFVKTFKTEDRELLSAEDVAKRNRRRLWKNYDPEAEKAAIEARRAANNARKQKEKQLIEIVVTEIIDGGHFYAQIVGEKTPEGKEEVQTENKEGATNDKRKRPAKTDYKEEIAQLEALMKELSEDEDNEPHVPRGNEVVKAQFTEDDAWYRARVLTVDKANQEATVQYIDYGNSESIKWDRIRKLKPAFGTLRPQAYECFLSSINVPGIDDDFGREAAEFFKELVWGKTVDANLDYKEGRDVETLHLSLSTENDMHVNAAMLHNGLARCSLRRDDESEIAKTLRDEEVKARQQHVGLWRYGDPGEDGDDDDFPRRR